MSGYVSVTVGRSNNHEETVLQKKPGITFNKRPYRRFSEAKLSAKSVRTATYAAVATANNNARGEELNQP